MKRPLFGMGINDADYKVDVKIMINGKQTRKGGFTCPFYRRWADMLKRCYSDKYHITRPSYKDCSVCDEWLLFSNFREWMITQDWKGKELDKDILVKGNKIYSPENCVFVDRLINNFIADNEWERGDCPLGVTQRKDTLMFAVKCKDYRRGRNSKYIGQFHNKQDAHLAWKRYKLNLARHISEMVSDERIKRAIIERYE